MPNFSVLTRESPLGRIVHWRRSRGCQCLNEVKSKSTALFSVLLKIKIRFFFWFFFWRIKLSSSIKKTNAAQPRLFCLKLKRYFYPFSFSYKCTFIPMNIRTNAKMVQLMFSFDPSFGPHTKTGFQLFHAHIYSPIFSLNLKIYEKEDFFSLCVSLRNFFDLTRGFVIFLRRQKRIKEHIFFRHLTLRTCPHKRSFESSNSRSPCNTLSRKFGTSPMKTFDNWLE